MIGHDLTLAKFADQEGRAIMQYYGTQAYMQGDQVAILRKDMDAAFFSYDRKQLTPQTADIDTELAKLALAHANWSSMAYEQDLYRLPTGGAAQSPLHSHLAAETAAAVKAASSTPGSGRSPNPL
jgi:hypothetical protein